MVKAHPYPPEPSSSEETARRDSLAVCFQKGTTYKSMGLLAEAIYEFEKCFADQSLKYRAVREIASCFLAHDSEDQAEKILLKALISPKIPQLEKLRVYADLADLYVKQDKLESALERLLQIRNEEPEFVPGLEQRIEELYSRVESVSGRNEVGITAESDPADPLEQTESVVGDVRRRARRVRFSNRVMYSFDQANWSTGYSTDISKSGMFVLTYKPIPVGSLVFLKFGLPESLGRKSLELIGQTVRQETKRHSQDGVLGMGVHFISVTPELRKKLLVLVTELYSKEKDESQGDSEIRFQCDFCGRVLSAAESLSGQTTTCTCGQTIPVPYAKHSPAPDNPFRGAVLAGCRIDKMIGEGSAAIVYKGHHLALDIPVAVKILNPFQKKTGTQMAKRFLKEARVIARIKHENIVAVMNAGEEKGRSFIIMQYVAGRSLAQVLQDTDKVKLNDFIRVFLDITAALQAAHEHSIIHGDIKPANILITPAGTAMLVDFGLVKDLKAYEGEKTKGLAFGTPLYMSPEQAKGEYATDFRSDIYSLGATMYHALSGRPPFLGLTGLEVIRKQIYDKPISLTELTPEVPAKIADLVAKTLAKDPADRFPSAEMLRQALMKISRDVAIDQFKPLLKMKFKAVPQDEE
jgi:tRNA A-37 threonylcarbamoyl transferase component Bud32